MSSIQNLDLPSENKQCISDFIDNCFSEGLTVPRTEKYSGNLKKIASLIPVTFRKATKKDIEKVVRVIKLSNYSEWTKRDFRITFKKFYQWLRD